MDSTTAISRLSPADPLDAAEGGSPSSEWIHLRLALVETLDGFNDLLAGLFTRDGEIIVNHCGLVG